MTQSQIPVAMLIAALSGVLAGLFVIRSWRASIIAAILVATFNVFGWAYYGYSLNTTQGATFTFQQVIASFVLVLPGLIIFFGLPAIASSFVIGLLLRALRRRTAPADVPKHG
jgi:hypothetical protein